MIYLIYTIFYRLQLLYANPADSVMLNLCYLKPVHTVVYCHTFFRYDIQLRVQPPAYRVDLLGIQVKTEQLVNIFSQYLSINIRGLTDLLNKPKAN